MLGSRKLLIVLCIVPCVLSLLCIGAFAAPAEDVTLSVDYPLETEVVEEFVKSPSALAEETFPAVPLLSSSYYSFSTSTSSLPWTQSGGFTNVLSLSLYDHNGTYVFGRTFDEPVTVWRSAVSNGDTAIVWGVSSDDYFAYSPFSGGYALTVDFLSSDSTQTTASSTTINGTLVEESLVPEIGDSIFNIGDALITFIVSSWVVMIPLAAWLVILCIGAIRKLVKGV